MTRFILLSFGFAAFVAGEPNRGGWLIRALQRLTQIVVVAGVATLATAAVASLTRGMIDDKEVLSSIEKMVALPEIAERSHDADNKDKPPSRQAVLMGKIKEEIGGTLYLEVIPSKNQVGYAVFVGIGEDPTPPSIDPCAKTLTAPLNDAVCLFRINPFLQADQQQSEQSGFLPRWFGILGNFISNFVEFEFPGTAYSIPNLVISAAKARDPNMKFTNSRKANIREMVDELIGQSIFLPSDSAVLWGRRFNGPIQSVTFFLSAIALIFIVLAWTNSVAQNWAVHLVRSVPLSREQLQSDATSPSFFDKATPVADGGTDKSDEDTSSAEQDEPLNRIDDLPTPWSDEFFQNSPLDLSDAHQTAEYYERVSRQIQRDSRVLGVYVDPPALRLRRAAVQAVANTQDTSILPPFLDAQKSSILSYYDARLSLVRYLLWAIPTVGFIGTILGVSGALSSTIGLQSVRDLISGSAQSSVSASMGMAFDTTLVALIAAMVVMLFYHVVQGTEERMAVLNATAWKRKF